MQERPVDQGPQVPQRCPGDLLGRLPAKAPAKDGQRLKDLGLAPAEHAPGMVKDGADAAVPLGHVAPAGVQEVEALGDAVRDLGRSEHLGPGRGQEEGQRHAARQAADAGHVLLLAGQDKAGAGPPRRGQEQVHGVVLPLCDLVGLLFGAGQAADGEEMLTLQAQPGAGGDQDRHARGGLEDVDHDVDTVEEVLVVVDEEQHPLPAQVMEELLPGLAALVEGEADGLGHGGDDGLGRAGAGEADLEDAVLVVGKAGGGRLEGQAGLADAALADEGQEAAGGVAQTVADEGQLGFAPDKGGQLRRQVVARCRR